jgi:hypothetical protein
MDAVASAVTVNEHARITDRDRTPFDVLVTAVDADTVLPYLNPAVLPHFDSGPCWTVRPEAALNADGSFDLAIALCAHAAQLTATASLVQRLTARRIPTVGLVPAALDHFVFVPRFLTVVTPCDLAQGISMLAHTLRSPVQQDGIVCCDWADIIATRDDGSRAHLASAEAPSAGEAMRALAERLIPLATGDTYGVVAALDIIEASSIRDWYLFRRVVTATAQQNAMVLASAPVTKCSATIATAMVLTAPSSRYFRETKVDGVRADPGADPTC